MKVFTEFLISDILISLCRLFLIIYGNSTKDTHIASDYNLLAQVVVEFMDAMNIDAAYLVSHSKSSILVPRIRLNFQLEFLVLSPWGQ